MMPHSTYSIHISILKTT
jgi:hypothetical protein